MNKYILQPDEGNDTGTETAYAAGVMVEAPDFKRVYLSGVTANAETDDIETETKDTLEQLEQNLEEYGGGIEDIVRVQVFVNEDKLTEENFEKIHKARREFFDSPNLPASTLVEIRGLVRDSKMIEIDADAIIPKDGWEVETL